MTGQDDLTKKGAEQKQAEDVFAADKGEPTDSASDVESQALSSGPEKSKAEGPATADIAGQGIASGEVRAVEPPVRQGASNLPLLVALLLVVLFGIGYYVLSDSQTSSVPPAEIAERQPMPKRYEIDKQVKEVRVDQQTVAAVEEEKATEPVTKVATAAPEIEKPETKTELITEPVAELKTAEVAPLYQVMVGPFLSKKATGKATEQLRELGFKAQSTKGRGLVTMIRLREGIYPVDKARERLEKIKRRVSDAFYLPAGDKRAIYVGSFSDPERAASYITKLEQKGVRVTQVPSEVEMSGRMLIALEADQKTAQQVAALISKSGLKTQVIRK